MIKICSEKNRGETMVREKASFYIHKLRDYYGEPTTALEYSSPFQLLLAVILSAQTTDKQVNKITPRLFARYPTPEKLAAAEPSELEELIRGIGLFRNKARALINCAQKLLKDFDGKVPANREKLMSLPGVGRKSANVVLAVAFARASFPVDTHVFRVSRRLGLSRGETPEQVEKDIIAIYPEKEWINFHHLLISHGREICKARRPLCFRCPVQKECPSCIAV